MNQILIKRGRNKSAVSLAGVIIALFVIMGLFAGCGNNNNQKSEEHGSSADNTSVVIEDKIKDSVDDYSWDELKEISEEIASSSNEEDAIEVAKKYNLTTKDGNLDGSQVKTVKLTDGTEAAVQIAGFAHDNITSGGKAGITFIFKDTILEHPMNSSATNSGGWESSAMRSWLASDGLNMMPADLKDKIVAVDKRTNNVGKTSSVSSVTTTSDKLWLYSTTELYGTITMYLNSSSNSVLNAEGSEYKLFRDTNVNSRSGNSILVKNFQGSWHGWWERSPLPDGSYGFEYVSDDGDCSYAVSAHDSRGVVPGFCI